jgi:dephospho-CoA kinase
MIVIGLTGGIGSGKSTVASMLTKAHIPVIDADILAREASAEPKILEHIKARFGKGVFNSDNTLNRSALAHIVFNDKNLLYDLEQIIHPEIQKLFREKYEFFKKKKYKIIVYMVPLLFEKKLEDRVDKILLVIASAEKQINRIINRDGLNHEEAKLRLAAQMTNEEKIAYADEIIENNGSLDELFCQLQKAWLRLCNMDLSNV